MGNNTMPKCQCPQCNALGANKYAVRRRGGNNAYLCRFHTDSLESYFTENPLRIGNMKANGITCSYENETAYVDFVARLELCVAGFLPTADSTVFAEFKSPIYNGFNGFKAYLPTMQWLIDNGHMRIDNTCGTHFHCGHDTMINSRTMAFIRRFYHSLFLPLCLEMENNHSKTAELFGRDFGYWASEITANTNPETHTNFINTQHENTLEFRLAYFKNAEQYGRCADFCRAVTEKVVNTFCSKVVALGLTENDRYLTPEQKTELKKAADKTARQIVKLYRQF